MKHYTLCKHKANNILEASRTIAVLPYNCIFPDLYSVSARRILSDKCLFVWKNTLLCLCFPYK